jgi:septal ring factor EnvC (AmiA/AmiB activator)
MPNKTITSALETTLKGGNSSAAFSVPSPAFNKNNLPATPSVSQADGNIMQNYQQQLANNLHDALTKWTSNLTSAIQDYDSIRKQRYFSSRIRKKQVALINAALQNKNLHYSLLYNELYKVFSQIEPTGFWGRKSVLYAVLEKALSSFASNVIPAAKRIEDRNTYLLRQWNTTQNQHTQASEQVSSLTDQVAALKADNQNLQTRLNESQAREGSLKQQNEQLKNTKANVEKQLEGARNANQALQAEALRKTETITELKIKNTEHIKEKDTLRQDLEKLTQEKQRIIERAKAIQLNNKQLKQANEAYELHKQQHLETIHQVAELNTEIEIIMTYLNEEVKKKSLVEEKLRIAETQLQHEKSRTQKLIAFIQNLVRNLAGKVFSGLNKAEERELNNIIKSEIKLTSTEMECRPVTRESIRISYETKQKFAAATKASPPIKQSTLMDKVGSIFAKLPGFTTEEITPTVSGDFPPARPTKESNSKTT